MFDITEHKQVDEVLKKRQQEIEELNAYLEKRIQEEVEKSRQKDFIMMHQSRLAAVGEMVGNIAHQWRQPLNALSIFVNNIKDICENSGQEKKELDEYIEKCFNLIMKMSSTIDDFRNFFKPDKKKKKFNINKTVENSLSLIDASLNCHSISVVVNEREKLTAVGYPNEYSQVILNILDNAKDAIVLKGIEGEIKINVERESDSGVVKIKDNGVGIPEDVLDNIFDPYYTTKKGGEGTGIGLYISKMIIEEHMNGRIEVQNDNQGTEFKVIVPTIHSE
jgi:signal transduction histidine kinase